MRAYENEVVAYGTSNADATNARGALDALIGFDRNAALDDATIRTAFRAKYAQTIAQLGTKADAQFNQPATGIEEYLSDFAAPAQGDFDERIGLYDIYKQTHDGNRAELETALRGLTISFVAEFGSVMYGPAYTDIKSRFSVRDNTNLTPMAKILNYFHKQHEKATRVDNGGNQINVPLFYDTISQTSRYLGRLITHLRKEKDLSETFVSAKASAIDAGISEDVAKRFAASVRRGKRLSMN